jgi:hypothetical protein
MMFMGSASIMDKGSIGEEILQWVKDSEHATLIRCAGHLGPTVIEFDNKDEKLRFILTWYNGQKHSIFGDFFL